MYLCLLCTSIPNSISQWSNVVSVFYLFFELCLFLLALTRKSQEPSIFVRRSWQATVAEHLYSTKIYAELKFLTVARNNSERIVIWQRFNPQVLTRENPDRNKKEVDNSTSLKSAVYIHNTSAIVHSELRSININKKMVSYLSGAKLYPASHVGQ